MSEVAIRIEGLGKCYRIGSRRVRHRTLRDAVVDLARAPVARFVAGAADGKAETPESELWALRDVSLEIQRGEIVGIVGRNGAGKSTLLKILSRITEPTLGRVGIRGRIGSLLEVGTGFHPELTGRENVFLNGAILGMKRQEIVRNFDEIVAFAEIERFLDTPVKHYSSGMHMRLAFAVAAHLEPEILVVDEVLAVGDAQFQKKCLGKMSGVASQGRTVLFVSHNMHVVRRLCTRGIWLEDGQVRMDDSSASAVRGYLASMTISDEGGGRSEEELRDHAIGHFVSWGVANEMRHRVESGAPFALELDVVMKERARGVYFGVALWSESEALIWGAASHDFAGTHDLDPGRYRVRFLVDHMPLASGTYSLELSINVPDAQLDHWYATPLLTVTSSRTTMLPKRWQGTLQLDCRVDIHRQT